MHTGSPQVALSVIGRALAATGPATAAAAPRPTDGAGLSFLVPCLPPVPGGAAAARAEGAPPESPPVSAAAPPPKRPRNSQ